MDRIVAVVLALGVAGGLTLAAPVAAGDGSILIYSEEDSYAVTPGEQIEIVVVVSDHGTEVSDGVENISLVAEYDSDSLQATDIEAEGWFDVGDGERADTDSAIDSETGVVTMNQTREPAVDDTV